MWIRCRVLPLTRLLRRMWVYWLRLQPVRDFAFELWLLLLRVFVSLDESCCCCCTLKLQCASMATVLCAVCACVVAAVVGLHCHLLL